MRAWGALVVAMGMLLAAAPAGALPTPPPGPFVGHAAISITSNAGFTAANGVVSGTGALGDPYVISGWSIYAPSGIAIRIHNVTAHFVVRDNAIDASVGVQITDTPIVGVVLNNQFVVRSSGVLVVNADAHIVDNSFIGHINFGINARAVDLYTSNSRVESNAFVYVAVAVRAERGSPAILCNDLHDDIIVAGIYVVYTTGARIECNTITRCYSAITSVSAIGTIVANNTLDNCRFGLHVFLTKDVHVANNTFRGGIETQVRFDTTSGNFTGNAVINGQADAVVVFRSPLLFTNNTISNHVGIGVRFQETTSDVHANVVSHNTVGITLESSSLPWLTANVFVNNTVGIDIPYASRQVIVNMSANVVNGVNIDGTLVASQRVYFYQQANITITAQVRDSGFSAGYYGSLTAQGGVVLYDVNTANINATVISHHSIGVGVVNSFNVNVDGSVLLSNLVGVKAEVKVGGAQVPNCVVSIKDTNITIPVDPIATVGIDIKGCFAIVGRVNVSVVDTGIRADAQSSLILFNSTIFDTKLALDIQGKPNEVNLSGNFIYNNRAGAKLSGTVGPVTSNTFLDNDLYGIRLENTANLVLVANDFTANGVGIIDAEVCLGPLTCSSITARANSFVSNLGAGAQINGPSSWRGDVALGNGGRGFDLSSSATLLDVFAAGNGDDGARILGTFSVKDSTFTQNGGDGLDITGSGDLRDSNFIFNELAGIRMASTFVSGVRLNISYNFDGILTAEGVALGGPPVLSVPGLLALATGVAGDGADPIDIHRSTFLGNERDAIRAGAAIINATANYWGKTTGPSVSVLDTLGAFQNGVSPAVRFAPYYTDATMTTTGPVAGL